jgi:hypothetical protein
MSDKVISRLPAVNVTEWENGVMILAELDDATHLGRFIDNIKWTELLRTTIQPELLFHKSCLDLNIPSTPDDTHIMTTKNIFDNILGGSLASIEDNEKKLIPLLNKFYNQLDGLATDKINKSETNIITNLVASVDIDSICLTFTIYDTVNETSSNIVEHVNLSTSDIYGAMSKEKYGELNKLVMDINQLFAEKFTPLGNIDIETALVTDTLLNQKVTDMGLNPKLNYTIKDRRDVTWLCNNIIGTPTWIKWGDTPIPIANINHEGYVKSKANADTNKGKYNVTTDGTLVLIGWDWLVQLFEWLPSQINLSSQTLSTNSNTQTHSSKNFFDNILGGVLTGMTSDITDPSVIQVLNESINHYNQVKNKLIDRMNFLKEHNDPYYLVIENYFKNKLETFLGFDFKTKTVFKTVQSQNYPTNVNLQIFQNTMYPNETQVFKTFRIDKEDLNIYKLVEIDPLTDIEVNNSNNYIKIEIDNNDVWTITETSNIDIFSIDDTFDFIIKFLCENSLIIDAKMYDKYLILSDGSTIKYFRYEYDTNNRILLTEVDNTTKEDIVNGNTATLTPTQNGWDIITLGNTNDENLGLFNPGHIELDNIIRMDNWTFDNINNRFTFKFANLSFALNYQKLWITSVTGKSVQYNMSYDESTNIYTVNVTSVNNAALSDTLYAELDGEVNIQLRKTASEIVYDHNFTLTP